MSRKNDVTNWRNDKKDVRAIFEDNKKFLMPAILVVAVALTVSVALYANHRTTKEVASNVDVVETTAYEVPDVTMEENAYPEVNALVERYYEASANGDADTLAAIYVGLDETEVLKAVAASEYIERFENITVYTKPGPVEGSHVAYVYNEVRLYDYDKNVPGLETLYICTNDEGELYINGDIADVNELEYLKQINVQSDVIDLNNKVASSYNEMVSADEELAELLTKMRSGLQVSVGEALATNENETVEEAEETEKEEVKGAERTVTTRIIKATDVVNIRSSDSETADILDKTEKGQEFKEIEALANGWSKIEYKDGVAYVKTEFFDVVSTETTTVPVSDDDEEEIAVEDEEETTAEDKEDTKEKDDSKDKVDSKDKDDTKDKDDSKAKDDSKDKEDTSLDNKVSSNSKSGKMSVKETVKFRREASTESDAMATIYKGSKVNVIEQYSNGWSKVEYNNITGYIMTEFLED